MEVALSTSYIQHKLQPILLQIENSWNSSGAWQDYQTAMRQTLPQINDPGSFDQIPVRFTLLPGLCCEAAGGQFAWADRVAAAWLLLYNSAHIFDNLEDKDQPDPCWSAAGEGVAINAASGMIFSAYLCLQGLYEDKISQRIASKIIVDFSNTLLVMGSGQHQDLYEQNPGLESWLNVAGAKSGSFFALACRAGAQLATKDCERIQHYSDFGYHLGILLQLLDDIGDFKAYQQGDRPVLPEALQRSFVVAYAFEVSSKKEKQQLREALACVADHPTAAQDVIRLLDHTGAGLYLAMEKDRQRKFGLSSLELAMPMKSAEEKISAMIWQLTAD